MKKESFKGKLGGRRPGAGRHPMPLYKAREKFNQLIDQNWDAIVKWVKLYADKGDKEMLKYILDQRIGRSVQSMDITSGGNEINTMSYEQAREILREGAGGNKGNKPA